MSIVTRHGQAQVVVIVEREDGQMEVILELMD
jgi:hypothetical protein